MDSPPQFDLIRWLNEKDWASIEGYEKLLSTLSFPVLWNLLEFKLQGIGNGSTLSMGTIEAFVNHLSSTGKLKNYPLDDIREYFSEEFQGWDLDGLTRYLLPDAGKAPEGVFKEGKRYMPLLFGVLAGNKIQPEGISQALLFVAYRIRNNFFHGIKNVRDLEGQKDLFNALNLVISRGLDAYVGN